MGHGASTNRLVAQVLAREANVPKEKVQQLRKVFGKRAAEDGAKTTLNAREFEEALKDVDIDVESPLGRALVGPLFAAFDTAGQGEVNFKEFVLGIAALTTRNMEARMRLAFDALDANGDHVLSRDELVAGLGGLARALAASQAKAAPSGADASLGLPFDVDHGEVEAFVDELIKANGADGQLTLAQFLASTEVHPMLSDVWKALK